MITFYVLVSARLSEKWQSKTLFPWKKISLPEAQISHNYTSYYQLTFSESISTNCFSDLWLVIHGSYLNSYKIVKNTSGMKQSNWTASCTQNEAVRAGETLIGLESVTEKLTGNAQPGACVAVLPRCCCLLAILCGVSLFSSRLKERLRVSRVILNDLNFKMQLIRRKFQWALLIFGIWLIM